MSKQVYVVTTERCRYGEPKRTSTYIGTLDYLCEHVFGYTIECNGYDKNCKSLKTMLGRLNGGTSYWSISTYYSGRKATNEEAKSWYDEHKEYQK